MRHERNFAATFARFAICKKLREITRECSKATRSMQNTRFISHAKTGKKMRAARKSPPVIMPRKENQIMMKQLTENG